jgi:hypothetical protein
MTLTLLPPTEERGSWQADLFSPAASVHDVIAAQGVKGAIEAAEYLAFTTQGAPPLSRALAGRMGRQIADNASAAIVREFEGQAQLGYSYSAWCLAGLPPSGTIDGPELADLHRFRTPSGATRHPTA